MTRIFIKNHRAPRLLQIVALFIFIFPLTQSGWAQSHAQIRNVDFTVRNDSLFVTYDLDKATKQERFTISLKISTPSGKITTPYTLSGDVGEQITGGQNKLIIWNIGKDNIVINEEIAVEVIATPNESAVKFVSRGKAGKTQVIKTVREVPDLIIKEEAFEDPNGNNLIDGNENSAIRFKIENIGAGVAKDVTVYVSLKNKSIRGLEYRASTTVGQIKPNEIKDIVIPIQGKIDQEQGLAEFKIEVKEERGFDAFPLEMKIETHPFEPPHVIVADAVFSTENGGKLKLNNPMQMKFVVQNIGGGDATYVNISCSLPNGDCLLTGESDKFTIGRLAKGESRELEFLFVATRRYSFKEIPIRISVSEKIGKYGQDTTVSVRLDQELLAQSQVVIAAIPTPDQLVQKVSLSSAVDKNIPFNSPVNNKKFALVIGNEDYSKYQPGLQTEMNVLFARNDAMVVKDYVTRVMGFPEANVYLLQDATTGEMNQKLELISKLVTKTGADAELLFYYAGHGLPDETTRTPYLIPVDVSGTNLYSAIRLSEIYRKFSETGCKRITVFLDACFSGGGRESGLIASRSIRIKPSEENIAGNMVVFSATKDDQSAMPYKSEKHGLFTCFLLKKLQETGGNLTYGNLADYAYFWSSSQYDAGDAWYRSLNYSYEYVYRNANYFKSYGFTVRCLRD